MDHVDMRVPGSSLFQNRDYMLLWGGQTVSTLGSSVSAIAFPLLILSFTGSPALAGLAGGLRALPYLLLSLPAGALVDRWNLRWVMMIADAGRAIALASVAIASRAGHLSLAQLYAVTIIEGTLFVLYDIANVSVLPRIVPPAQLAPAVAQNEGTYYAVTLVGPAAGGVLYQVGQGLPFAADALSYLASVLSLFWMRVDLHRERTEQPRHLAREMIEGLTWVRRQPIVRSLSLLYGGDALVSSGSALLVIVLARQQHASPSTIGMIFSLAGIGGIIGAISGGQIQKYLRFGQTIIGVRWALVFLWPLYVVAPTPVTLGMITAAVYFLNPVSNVAGMSYGLSLIPDHLRGRVNSIFQLLPAAMASAGAACMGLALQAIGPRPTAAIASGIVLLLAVMVTLNADVRSAPSIAPRPVEEA